MPSKHKGNHQTKTALTASGLHHPVALGGWDGQPLSVMSKPRPGEAQGLTWRGTTGKWQGALNLCLSGSTPLCEEDVPDRRGWERGPSLPPTPPPLRCLPFPSACVRQPPAAFTLPPPCPGRLERATWGLRHSRC